MSKQITAFVRAHFATLESGVAVDYISFCRREGEKHWPQVARLNHGGRSLDDLEAEAARLVEDIVQTAREERRKEQKIRLSVYRAQELVSTRTFTLPGVVDGSHEEEPVGDGRTEAVATLRELRLIVVDQNASLMRVAGRGWELAMAQQQQLMNVQAELHQARLELALQKAQKGMSPEASAALQAALANAPVLLTMLGELFKSDKPADS